MFVSCAVSIEKRMRFDSQLCMLQYTISCIRVYAATRSSESCFTELIVGTARWADILLRNFSAPRFLFLFPTWKVPMAYPKNDKSCCMANTWKRTRMHLRSWFVSLCERPFLTSNITVDDIDLSRKIRPRVLLDVIVACGYSLLQLASLEGTQSSQEVQQCYIVRWRRM